MITREFKNKGLIIFLLFLVLIIGYLAYQNNRDFNSLKSAFDDEKADLEKELDGVIRDYQNTITDNHALSAEIDEQLRKVLLFKDTLRELRSSNYKSLRIYRKRISTLEQKNKMLLGKLDSLNSLNENLNIQNDSVRTALTKTEELNQVLSQNNEVLGEKIASSELLKIAKVEFVAMKYKGNGTLTNTYRSWRTSVFKVQFDLLENKVIEAGTKQIHIQILNPRGEVINAKGRIQLKNKNKIFFSDVIEADYYQQKLGVTSLVRIKKGSLEEGNYTVKIYVNRIFTKQKTIRLK